MTNQNLAGIPASAQMPDFNNQVELAQRLMGNFDRAPKGDRKPKESEDPRYWKLICSEKVPTSRALIRPLPDAGDVNKLFSVPQAVHKLWDDASRTFVEFKCRKTLGPNEKCLGCEMNMKMSRNATPEQKKGFIKERYAKNSFISNIYVINDILTPTNNFSVKLYRHSEKMAKTLMSPISKEGYSVVDPNAGFNAEAQIFRFSPHNPFDSYNFIVSAAYDYQKKMPDYFGNLSSSKFDLSWHGPLGNTQQEVDAILSQCVDLTTMFLSDIPTVEETGILFQKFLDGVAQGGFAQPGVQGYVQGGLGAPSAPNFAKPAGAPSASPMSLGNPTGFPQTPAQPMPAFGGFPQSGPIQAPAQKPQGQPGFSQASVAGFNAPGQQQYQPQGFPQQANPMFGNVQPSAAASAPQYHAPQRQQINTFGPTPVEPGPAQNEVEPIDAVDDLPF
jgi:hypothetical protein